MPRSLRILMVFCGGLGLAACDMVDNEVTPGVSFTRIYDDRTFNAEYAPLDIVQTEDEGYLGLAATQAWNAYMFKTDRDGQFLWEIKVEEAFVNPLAKLILLEDQHLLFCMNEVTLATAVMQVDVAAQTTNVIAQLDEIQYPLAVSVTADQSLLVLGYDRESRSSTLHKLNQDFSEVWSHRYAVEEDVEEMIIRHMARTGRRLPFLVGSSLDGQSYYFNGFANYTLGLNFVNPQTGDLVGMLNGFRADGFVNSVHHLEGNRYALARSSFGVNTLLPRVEINPQAIASSSDLMANDFPEIDSEVYLLPLSGH